MGMISYRDAINTALADELAADEDVFLLGEDIAAAGGVFKVTDGLLGDRRVDDPPRTACSSASVRGGSSTRRSPSRRSSAPRLAHHSRACDR
jgi:pyruvate/2-oxoglutarate/acetoin dehydrogenase E1 component